MQVSAKTGVDLKLNGVDPTFTKNGRALKALECKALLQTGEVRRGWHNLDQERSIPQIRALQWPRVNKLKYDWHGMVVLTPKELNLPVKEWDFRLPNFSI